MNLIKYQTWKCLIYSYVLHAFKLFVSASHILNEFLTQNESVVKRNMMRTTEFIYLTVGHRRGGSDYRCRRRQNSFLWEIKSHRFKYTAFPIPWELWAKLLIYFNDYFSTAIFHTKLLFGVVVVVVVVVPEEYIVIIDVKCGLHNAHVY